MKYFSQKRFVPRPQQVRSSSGIVKHLSGCASEFLMRYLTNELGTHTEQSQRKMLVIWCFNLSQRRDKAWVSSQKLKASIFLRDVATEQLGASSCMCSGVSASCILDAQQTLSAFSSFLPKIKKKSFQQKNQTKFEFISFLSSFPPFSSFHEWCRSEALRLNVFTDPGDNTRYQPRRECA